jgi:hypothetical protein
MRNPKNGSNYSESDGDSGVTTSAAVDALSDFHATFVRHPLQLATTGGTPHI